MSRKSPRKSVRMGLEPLEPRQMLTGIVINEIHVDPEISTEQVEFIELYNSGTDPVDVGGWVIDKAVDFEFPAGTTIDADDYFVVTQDGDDFQAKFGFSPDGIWEVGDKLSNDGEKVELRDHGGVVVDVVDYQLGFPWPTVGEIGRSMELIHPSLDNDLSGSWRASGGGDSSGEQFFLTRAASDWSYRPGTSEASSPIDAWRFADFSEDASWQTATTPIGYGDSDDNTILSDMRNSYTSVFLRNTFDLDTVPSSLKVGVYSDDGAVVWINGTRVASLHVNDQELAFDDTAFNHEAEWEELIVPNAQQFLVQGENTIAVQGFNQSLSSSDFSIDVELSLPPVAAGLAPTPGQQNAAFATNAAPQLRQVSHTPEQPTAGEDVVVTMKATDPDGVAELNLEYQIVNPGAYIRLTDAAYETNWTSIAMNDDGIGGDETAGDSVYSATIPGSLNVNRRLMRYRINAMDTLGTSVQVPYADDPQPNFAYFVYNGVPDYTASLRPGVLPNQTYSGGRLDDMATYHLIANAQDVDRSQYNGGYNLVQFWGTLVYEGDVYDHIEYRNRGRGSTYQVGKNKWKINFARGHSFKVRDEFGERREEDWDKINILPGTNPWWRNDVSTEGTVLFEPVAFRLFELAGTPAPRTQHFQFRVIDGSEAPADQYAGDFWGLYTAIEQPDGRFLKERGLPDGNIYNLHGGTFGATSQRNQGSEQVSDRSDLSAFINGVNSGFQTAQAWESNINLDSYFAWNMINHVSNNSDIRNHENVNYYHNQETDQWYILPWDLDLTFEDRPHHNIPVTNRENIRRMLNVSSIQLQYHNRLRELTDLLLDNGDAAAVVEEYYHLLTGGDGSDLTFTDSNQAQWDYHPRKNKKGIWYDNFNSSLLDNQSFAGLADYMQDFVSQGGYGYNLLQDRGNDSGIPNRPSVTHTGAGFAPGELSFQSSNFSDPQGAGTFAAMEWRVAEVYNSSVANYQPGTPYIYEIEDLWESGEITTFDNQVTVPQSVVEVGKTYRLRVRMQDNSGRWSHWSNAQEFQVTPGADPVQSAVIISEINYNPSDPTPAELAAGITDKDDFEFIELINTSSEILPISNFRFEQVAGEGVNFDFGSSSISELAPGERVLVVENLAAFNFRYGTNLPVAGVWSGGLGNGGELITLTVGGGISQQFEYSDDWHPSTDNGGDTLVLVDATNIEVDDWAVGALWQPSAAPQGSPGQTNLLGDFNEDGQTDATDIDMLCTEIGLMRHSATFDLLADLQVNDFDFQIMIQGVLGSVFGDANLDGFVDVSDFNIWNSNKFQTGTGWASGDFNCDGATDVSDFNIWNTNKFTGSGNGLAGPAAPRAAGEPGIHMEAVSRALEPEAISTIPPRPYNAPRKSNLAAKHRFASSLIYDAIFAQQDEDAEN